MDFFGELTSLQFILLYLGIVNLAGLLMMYIDKQRARRHAFRIPEATLFIIALAGGSIGCIVGMYLIRHKTSKWYFRIGMPAILFLQIILVILLWRSPYTFIFL